MAKSVFSNEYQTLLDEIVDARKAAGLTQQQVADRLDQHQSFVAKIEGGQRRIDVVEFLQITRIIGADPHLILKRLEKTKG